MAELQERLAETQAAIESDDSDLDEEEIEEVEARGGEVEEPQSYDDVEGPESSRGASTVESARSSRFSSRATSRNVSRTTSREGSPTRKRSDGETFSSRAVRFSGTHHLVRPPVLFATSSTLISSPTVSLQSFQSLLRLPCFRPLHHSRPLRHPAPALPPSSQTGPRPHPHLPRRPPIPRAPPYNQMASLGSRRRSSSRHSITSQASTGAAGEEDAACPLGGRRG